MQELWFLRSALRLMCLMLIDFYMKFREDSLNAFQVIERTRVWQTERQRQTERQTDRRPAENNVSQT